MIKLRGGTTTRESENFPYLSVKLGFGSIPLGEGVHQSCSPRKRSADTALSYGNRKTSEERLLISRWEMKNPPVARLPIK
ncbi:hypothetical protein J6590_025158 [Homalodisca vitripennis]|nr:hypothetical protein J6590_025158 [Homalodisca vitripennis]